MQRGGRSGQGDVRTGTFSIGSNKFVNKLEIGLAAGIGIWHGKDEPHQPDQELQVTQPFRISRSAAESSLWVKVISSVCSPMDIPNKPPATLLTGFTNAASTPKPKHSKQRLASPAVQLADTAQRLQTQVSYFSNGVLMLSLLIHA